MDKLARKNFVNGGGMVTGPGGVGKTQGLLKTCRGLLHKSGRVCHVIALTHVAARLARGLTIQRFLQRRSMHQAERAWIIMDEASQVPQDFWAELQRFKLVGARYLIVGDFKGQLRHPSDLWSDSIRRYEDSDDILALAERLHISLSAYRRGTHHGYYKWYCSLYADVPEDDACDYIGLTKLARRILVARERLRDGCSTN